MENMTTKRKKNVYTILAIVQMTMTTNGYDMYCEPFESKCESKERNEMENSSGTSETNILTEQDRLYGV